MTNHDHEDHTPGARWLFETIESLRVEQREQHQRLRAEITNVGGRIEDRLASVDAQVRSTNGRLQSAEKALIILETKWQGLVWVVMTILIPVAWWILEALKGWLQ